MSAHQAEIRRWEAQFQACLHRMQLPQLDAGTSSASLMQIEKDKPAKSNAYALAPSASKTLHYNDALLARCARAWPRETLNIANDLH